MRETTATTGMPSAGRLWASVLLTYPRRPVMWVVWCLVIAGAAFAGSAAAVRMLLKGAAPPDEVVHDNVMISTMFLCFTCMFVVAGVTEHSARLLALPRGPLVPRLAGPVIGVAAVLTSCAVAALCALWPRPLMAVAGGRFAVHAGALAAVVAAEGAWLQLYPRFARFGVLPFLVAVAPWGVTIYSGPRRVLFEMLAGGHGGLVVAIYSVAVALFVGLWVVMGRTRMWPGLALSAGDREPVRAGPVVAMAVSIPRLHVGVVSGWRRFRLRQFAVACGLRDSVGGLVGGVVLAVVALVIGHVFHPADEVFAPALLSLIVSVVAPVTVAARVCASREVLLTFEARLPQRRGGIYRDLGLATLANLLTLWCAWHVAMLGTFAVFAPGDLKAIAGTMGLMLGVGVVFQVYFFGLLAWYVSFRPNWINGAVFGVLSFSMIPVAAGIMDRPARTDVLRAVILASWILAAGVGLMGTAYWRWARREIR